MSKTATNVKRVKALAEEAIGADKPICLVDAADVKAVRDLIAACRPTTRSTDV